MFEADFLVMSVYVETIHSPSDGGRFPCNLPLPYMESKQNGGCPVSFQVLSSTKFDNCGFVISCNFW